MAQRYLILGANAAGLSAAVRIAKFDREAQITILERSDVVSFGACGIPYFVGGECEDIDQLTARPAQDFIRQGMDLRLRCAATALDPAAKVVRARDEDRNQTLEFSYDRLMIATGASPVMPPISGIESSGVHTMHSRQDALDLVERLPLCRNVVIIGAGFIGLEAAEAFAQRGKQVTVIEYAQRVMARALDAELTPHLEAALQRNGVQLRLGETVQAIRSEGGQVHSVQSDRDSYAADLVLIAVGYRPNTEFLAETALARSAQGALIVDRQCRTSLPDIFSAGDCATMPHRISGDRYLPLATTANKMGRIAGEIMAGRDAQFIGALGSSGIRVFDIEAGRTGIGEDEARALGMEFSTVLIEDKNHTDYVAGQTPMWVKLIYAKVSRKLLGGQIVGSFGSGAVHRVDALAVAVYAGLTVDELGMMDFVYAPPFARTWDILNVAGNVAK